MSGLKHRPPADAASATPAEGLQLPRGSKVAAVLLRLLDHSWVSLVAAFAISAPIGLVLIASTGADPWFATLVTIDATVGTVNGIVNTLVYAAPRLFVALGAIVALRTGLFNLGGEGQLQMGALGAIIGGYYAASILPGWLGIPAALVGAVLFGGLWAGIAALFKLWRGADEMIVTLLLNFIATYFVLFLIQGPLRAVNSSFNQSERVPQTSELPALFGTRLHAGVILAIIVTVLVAVFLSRTRLGLELRSVGLNAAASRFQGLPIAALTVGALVVSGGIAGLAGANEVLGTQFRLIQGFSPGYGFEGLAIAFLAGLRPFRAAVLALVFGGIYSAATLLQQYAGVPVSIAYVVEGIPIVLLATFSGLQLLRAKRRKG
ncbi:ABC transporter permease [Herbiconiux sp. CPCC 203407]|uniref:ABC transporter permease n=1 Tax=Herbiconiux oxytropis TaxID=2970915 RepID=A0AA42BUS9_9MICO|nr:ABC transporter permease [Herbiconiux oxytropis]MCS5722366.1 ABC transporter permease [Herbiconiux oxytropis]MCS5727237.1 ABC transporter permease [Herbiconiux oxytropis]